LQAAELLLLVPLLLLSSSISVPSGRQIIISPACSSLPALIALPVPRGLIAVSAVVRCHGAASLASTPAALRSLGLIVLLLLLLLAGRIAARGAALC
jgi:hypothetical protein